MGVSHDHLEILCSQVALVSFGLPYRTTSLDHLHRKPPVSLSWGLFSLAVSFPTERSSTLNPGGCKPGYQNCKTGKRAGDSQHLESFLFHLASLLSLCLRSPGQRPCILLPVENQPVALYHTGDRVSSGHSL